MSSGFVSLRALFASKHPSMLDGRQHLRLSEPLGFIACYQGKFP
jgi:hypothetical protein